MNATTLRSGIAYDAPSFPIDDAAQTEGKKVVEKGKGKSLTSEVDLSEEAEQTGKKKEKVSEAPFTPKLPFPHRMQQSNVDQQFGKFLAMVKNLEVTIPFTDLITQVPAYAKFLKDMITKKRDFGGVERVAFTE